jgi:hypothetical protein
MPRGVARRPGKVSGRPKAPAAVVAQAIALVRDEGLTCEEAGERVTPRLGGNTVRRAMKAQEAAADAPEVTTLDAAPVEEDLELALPADVSAAIVSIADVDKARAVRRLVQGMGGTWDGGAVESLAVTWGCAVADVQALVIEAAIQAGRCILPPELAREEAIAMLRYVREKAKTAADWKSVTLAVQELLKVQLAASDASEMLTKAQFVALARQLLDAVAPFPGAREAMIGVLSGAA